MGIPVRAGLRDAAFGSQVSRLVLGRYCLRPVATSAAMITTPSSTPTSRPARNCPTLTRSARGYEGRRQTLDVVGRHVGEPEPNVESCRSAGAQLGQPDHLRPAAHRGLVRQQDVEVEPAPDREVIIRVHADSAQADVLDVALVVHQLAPRRPANDVSLHPWIASAVGQGADSIKRRFLGSGRPGDEAQAVMG